MSENKMLKFFDFLKLYWVGTLCVDCNLIAVTKIFPDHRKLGDHIRKMSIES